MNDNVLSWAISGLGGALELLENQIKGREKINHEKVNRLLVHAEKLEQIVKEALEKQE